MCSSPALWSALTSSLSPYSSLPYPVPLHLVLYNILLHFAFIWIVVTHPRVRALGRARSQAGIRGHVMDRSFHKLPFFICSSARELEFPHIPADNVVYPGPILIPVPPLTRESYPKLGEFLDRDRTIIINLGSNFWYSNEDVVSVADAIVDARRCCPTKAKFQVLWKLNGKKAFEVLLLEKLAAEGDAVRVEEWIEPPTLAVLQHPNVVAFVNHGGASESCTHAFLQLLTHSYLPDSVHEAA